MKKVRLGFSAFLVVCMLLTFSGAASAFPKIYGDDWIERYYC